MPADASEAAVSKMCCFRAVSVRYGPPCIFVLQSLAEQRHYLIVSEVRRASNSGAVGHTELSGSTLLLGQMRLESESALSLNAHHRCELSNVVRAR